jgi:hypothetical protein
MIYKFETAIIQIENICKICILFIYKSSKSVLVHNNMFSVKTIACACNCELW